MSILGGPPFFARDTVAVPATITAAATTVVDLLNIVAPPNEIRAPLGQIEAHWFVPSVQHGLKARGIPSDALWPTAWPPQLASSTLTGYIVGRTIHRSDPWGTSPGREWHAKDHIVGARCGSRPVVDRRLCRCG